MGGIRAAYKHFAKGGFGVILLLTIVHACGPKSLSDGDQEKINMNRTEQFAIITKAREEVLKWVEGAGISLFRVEFVVPFVDDDFGLWVWLFYEKEIDVKDNDQNGISKRVSQQFLKILSELEYPAELMSEVGFTFDSDENVQANYEGSYFYRLR